MIINYPCEFCMCAVLDLNNPNPWYCTKTGEYSGLRIGLSKSEKNTVTSF